MTAITSYWDKGKLNSLGYLTLKSYLDHGYPVDLYVSDEVSNIPEGVVVKDAGKIAMSPFEWGSERIRVYADYWRFCFLANHGGTWVDTDCPVVRELDFLKNEPFFARETQQWHGGLLGALIHVPEPGHPAMVGLRKFYEDPNTPGDTLQERRRNIGWYAYCKDFYRFASKEDQAGEPGRFTPLREPGAVDGPPLSTEGRYDGSVRLIDYAESYTLHLVGCYFNSWKRKSIMPESLIGDLVKKHIGDVDVADFLFGCSVKV